MARGTGRTPVVRTARRPEAVLPELRPYDGEGLEAEGDHDGVEFADLDLVGQEARGARFMDCGLRRCGMWR